MSASTSKAGVGIGGRRSSPADAAPKATALSWSPPLGALRLVGDGRSVAMLSPDAGVLWWCAPDFDDRPLCWRLLDPSGGVAEFPGLQRVDADDAPAGASATTFLRDDAGTLEVRDGILSRGDGLLLVPAASPGSACRPR